MGVAGRVSAPAHAGVIMASCQCHQVRQFWITPGRAHAHSHPIDTRPGPQGSGPPGTGPAPVVRYGG